HAEHRFLEARRIGPLERPVKDEMLPRGGDRRRAAGQRLGGRRHFKLFLEHEHGGVSRGRDLNISAAAAMRTSLALPFRTSHDAAGPPFARAGGADARRQTPMLDRRASAAPFARTAMPTREEPSGRSVNAALRCFQSRAYPINGFFFRPSRIRIAPMMASTSETG